MLDTLRFIHLTAQVSELRKWQPRQVLALQQRRFRRILRHAYEHSPFYREQFRGIDLRTCSPSDLPVLTKATMMENFEEIMTDRRIRKRGVEGFMSDLGNLGKLYLGKYIVCNTSGTQGVPSIIVQEKQDLNLTFALQVARAHSRPKRWRTFMRRLVDKDRMAIVTVKPGFYPSGVAFAYMPKAAQRFVKIMRLSLFDAMEKNVARLNEFKPHFLTGYASILEPLAREEHAGRLRLRESGCLRQITNMSEPLPPSARELIESVFGVHVADHYAMGECMALAVGCPIATGAHLNADLAFLENVDDSYQPVPAGQPGSKILVTNLYNRVQPFIRYEIGDVVTMNPRRCSCGSNLPHIAAIQGRSADRFWVQANGQYRELSPILFLWAMAHCFDVRDYQVVQKERNRFVLRTTPFPGRTVSVEQLRNMIQTELNAAGWGNLIGLEIELTDKISPDPRSGKMRRVVALPRPSGLNHPSPS